MLSLALYTRTLRIWLIAMLFSSFLSAALFVPNLSSAAVAAAASPRPTPTAKVMNTNPSTSPVKAKNAGSRDSNSLTGWFNYTDTSVVRAMAIQGTTLWLGTLGGVVKFDTSAGKVLAIYTSANGLAYDEVDAIKVDSNGNVWAGTPVGLSELKANATSWLNFTTANSNLPYAGVSALAVDNTGNIWVGSMGSSNWAISKFNPIANTWQTYTNIGITLDNHLNVIAIASSGKVWVGFNYGLASFDGTNWQTYQAPNGASTFWIYALTIDSKGTIWIISDNIYSFDGTNWQTYQATTTTYKQFTSLTVDNSDNKWFTTPYYDNGPNNITSTVSELKSDNATWVEYPSSSKVGHSYLKTLVVDNTGTIWSGASNAAYVIDLGFLASFSPNNTWQTYNISPNNQPTNNLGQVATDSNGNAWVGLSFYLPMDPFAPYGTGGASFGLGKFDGSKWLTYTTNNSPLVGNYVSAVAVDKTNAVWVGDSNSGIFDIPNGLYAIHKLDSNGVWTTYNVSNTGMYIDVINAIAPDASGNSMWFGDYDNGAFRFDGSQWVSYTVANSGLPSNRVTTIAADPDGHTEWFGAYPVFKDQANPFIGGGLAKFDGQGNWVNYTMSNSGLISNTVQTIAIDKSGNKWIGTGAGLSRLASDNSTWQTYTSANSGLAANDISTLSIDKNNNLWIGYNSFSGLSKFSPATNTWQNYTVYNSGLAHDFVTSLATDPSGNLWITNGNGLNKLAMPAPQVKPSALAFVGTTATPPPAQQVALSGASGNSTWSSQVSYGSGASGWLNLAANGTLSPNVAQTLPLSVNLNGVSAGSYTATVTFIFVDSSNNSSTQVVNVSLVVPSSGVVYTYNLPTLANNLNGYTTYLVFQNPNASMATVQVQTVDSNGNPQANAAATCTTVAAFGECIVPNSFANGVGGSGVILSSQPINVLVAEATPYGGSAYAVSGGSSSQLISPLAFHNAYGDFSTRLTVFNAGSSATNVNVQFYDTNGNIQSGASQSFSLAAQHSQTLDQAVASSNLPDGFVGWASISGGSGSQLVAQVLEQSPNQHFVAIASAQAQSHTSVYAPAIFKGAFNFNTGANIINPSSQPIIVSVTYYDDSGNPTPTTPFSLGANSVQAIYQGGSGGIGLPSGGGLASGFSGTAIVTATGAGVVMVVNESGGVTSSGTALSGTYAAATSGANSIGLPVMANGGFGYTTGATIFNTSSNVVTGTIQYYDINGNTVGTAQTFSVGSHASQLVYQGAANLLPTGFYGTAVVTQTGGGSNLIVTTNALSSLFYTYTEPNY
jgi:ligand-binding sensor domain-containing protein